MVEEIETAKAGLHNRSNGKSWQEMWKKAFSNCLTKVDAEVGGAPIGNHGSNCDESSDIPRSVAPETVGSTAVVAVICPTQIIVANCGDSRAVLFRGKTPVPLSVDHKVRHLFLFFLKLLCCLELKLVSYMVKEILLFET